jgi:hypothetical protein
MVLVMVLSRLSRADEESIPFIGLVVPYETDPIAKHTKNENADEKQQQQGFCLQH